MKNMIKAQLYQMKKNRILYFMFAAIVMIQITTTIGEILYYDTEITVGKYVAYSGTTILSPAILMALLLTAEVCGADFIDKTCNYELMGGYRRKEVYMARTILSVILGVIFTTLLSFVPIIVVKNVGTWGTELDLRGVLVRCILLFFPLFRMICECVCLSYIVKNAYIVMGVSMMTFFVMMGGATMPETARIWSGFGAICELTDFNAWATYTLVGEKAIMIYDTSLVASDVVGIVLVSLGAGIMFLWIGYQFFAKDDMN